MTTKNILTMAALALMMIACSNEDEVYMTPSQSVDNSNNKEITITATLAPKGNDGMRAVSEGTNKIISTWAENEHIAILYEVSSVKKVADATITAVDGDGKATITFSVDGGTVDNTACQIVYPLSAAKDDNSGVKDAATLLAAQDGTLNANLDVRVGAGTIHISPASLDVTTQPAAQFAIFKFTVRKPNGTTAINVKPLTITIGTQDYIITPATATDVLYAALPAVSAQAVSFDATDGDSKTYTFTKSVTFTAGKFYQSTLKMQEYVLMGEGYNLKWATCNIGATNPQDNGSHYAWGEIATKGNYDWAHYKFIKSGYSDDYHINKYTFHDTYNANKIWFDGEGNFIGDNGDGVEHKDFASYNYEDDTARQIWGGTWRIPSPEEWTALLNNTNFTWEKTTIGSKKGWLVTSKVAGYVGNSIFLPLTGVRYNTSHNSNNVIASYWSSSLYTTSLSANPPSSMEAVALRLNDSSKHALEDGSRSMGYSVRPVAE